jgi:opacity protein-like surface antigen
MGDNADLLTPLEGSVCPGRLKKRQSSVDGTAADAGSPVVVVRGPVPIHAPARRLRSASVPLSRTRHIYPAPGKVSAIMKAAAYGLCLLLSLVMASAHAQDRERAVRWHLGLSFNPTIGTTGDYLENGWGLSGGLTWQPKPDSPFALRAELHYSGYDATEELIQLGIAETRTRIDDGDADVFGADVSGLFNVAVSRRVLAFAQLGVGLFRREVQLTQTALFNGILCDAWWGVCFPGVVVGDAVVGERSTTRLAWNTGVGMEFETANGSAWFVDVRYLRIETSEPTELIPIRVGFRF